MPQGVPFLVWGTAHDRRAMGTGVVATHGDRALSHIRHFKHGDLCPQRRFLRFREPNSVFSAAVLTVLLALTANRYPIDPGRWIVSVNTRNEVPAPIREKSSWVVILLGAIFIVDGLKAMTRWHQFGAKTPYLPLFRMAPPVF